MLLNSLVAAAVESAEDALDDVTDEALEVLNGNVDDAAGGANEQENIGEDTEPNKTVDVATDGALDVNVVLAALGAVRDAIVGGALGESEPAGEALDSVEDTADDTANDTASRDRQAVGVGVEEGDGIGTRLEVETGKATAGVLQADAAASIDIDGGTGVNLELSLDLKRSQEDDVLDRGLAVGVLRVVLDDLVRGASAEGAELSIDGAVDADRRLRPCASLDGTGAAALLGVPRLAGLARAGLGPGAVVHAGGALEGGALKDAASVAGIETRLDGRLWHGSGRGHGGERRQGHDKLGEVHDEG